MISANLFKSKLLFFSLKKINSITRLHRAFKHNKREIATELGAASHINASMTRLNYSLTNNKTSFALMQTVSRAQNVYRENVGREIRHDAVIAIEVLFSMPDVNLTIEAKKYFKDCLEWAVMEFAPASLLTADVHVDESKPHMHVLFLCVTPTSLVASKVSGNRGRYRTRHECFHEQVAKYYGLDLPPPKLDRSKRKEISDLVIGNLKATNDPVTRSIHFQAVCDAVKQNPEPFARGLNIELIGSAWRAKAEAQTLTRTARHQLSREQA